MTAARLPEGVRLEPIEELEDVREEWSVLAEGAGHPFATWEWNALWWERFAAGRELYSFICRDADGSALAILPLYIALARPIGVARFIGYADLHSPICAPEHQQLAAAALKEITRMGRVRLVLAERLPGDAGWGDLLGGRLLGRGNDRVVRFDGITWDEYLAGRSRNFRSQVGKRERKVVRETGLTFRLADDPARLEADMDALYRLHADRWEDESTGVFAGDRGAFHQAFAAAAHERGWHRLWLAEIDDKPVAAWYGWRFGGAEWSFNMGRVTDYDQLSLGLVLLTHSIRSACEDGMSAFHLLAGDDDYKSRFAEEDVGAETRLVGSAPLSAAGALGYKAAGSLPGAFRRRLTRS